MEIVLVVLLMCGKPETVIVIDGDNPPVTFYAGYTYSTSALEYLKTMLNSASRKITYEDPHRVCI